MAPEIAPAMEACCWSFGKLLPAKNCAPPFENWIMTGEFTFLAVSNTAFTVFELITLTAGKAKEFSFAYAYKSLSSSPYLTPGLNFIVIGLKGLMIRCNYHLISGVQLISAKDRNTCINILGSRANLALSNDTHY